MEILLQGAGGGSIDADMLSLWQESVKNADLASEGAAPVVASARYAYLHLMPILGHGIDIVETSRLRKMIDDHGQHFLDRVFTPLEQQYCARNHKRYYEHLAGRFAAKEAVLKVLGTGWRGGIAWTDIEVRSQPSGQPVVYLSGECLRIATELGISRWHLSISHIETHATASAIGLRASDATS